MHRNVVVNSLSQIGKGGEERGVLYIMPTPFNAQWRWKEEEKGLAARGPFCWAFLHQIKEEVRRQSFEYAPTNEKGRTGANPDPWFQCVPYDEKGGGGRVHVCPALLWQGGEKERRSWAAFIPSPWKNSDLPAF